MKTLKPIQLLLGEPARFTRACYGLPACGSIANLNPQRFTFEKCIKIEVSLPHEVKLVLRKNTGDSHNSIWTATFRFLTTRGNRIIEIAFEPPCDETSSVIRRALLCGKKFIYLSCKEKEKI